MDFVLASLGLLPSLYHYIRTRHGMRLPFLFARSLRKDLRLRAHSAELVRALSKIPP